MSIDIQQQIKKTGLKVTQGRVAVLSLLQGLNDDLSVKQMYQRLYLNHQPMSLATVYRVMSDLEVAGLIARNQFVQGEAKYTLPSTAQVQMLEIKCEELTPLNQVQFIESLQLLFKQYNANLLDVAFKEKTYDAANCCS